MVQNNASTGEGVDYSGMIELDGIAYTGFHKEKDLPVLHIIDSLFRMVKDGGLETVGDSYVFRHKQTGTFWLYSRENVRGGVREVLDLRHPSKSMEEAVAAGHECLGDLAGLLVGVKGI